MLKNSHKKTIAFIRAIDVRISQAEHAAHSKELRPFYISNYDKEIKDYLENKSAKYIPIDLKPEFLFDPVKLFSGRVAQQSWLIFKQKELEKVLKEIDFYQIQEPFFLFSGQVAGIAKKFQKPLIMAPWMCFNHPSTYIPPYSFSVKKSISQTDLFIVRTKRVENYLSRFKVPESKKVLIYHGVNLKRFFPGNERDSRTIRILFVGHLSINKGFDDILEVFPELVKESPGKIELVVCGSGSLQSKVVKMSESLPIKYMGQISNLELPNIYRSSDIFCGPSKDVSFFGMKYIEEGFGFVFAESLASGLPIVTNDSGAIKEVVGENNFVNKQGDKEALKNSLLELINDDKMRYAIGVKNRIRAEKMFDLEKQVAEEEKEIKKRFC
jgi:glycosyltransferase involved in cell wall biosynthesis